MHKYYTILYSKFQEFDIPKSKAELNRFYGGVRET